MVPVRGRNVQHTEYASGTTTRPPPQRRRPQLATRSSLRSVSTRRRATELPSQQGWPLRNPAPDDRGRPGSGSACGTRRPDRWVAPREPLARGPGPRGRDAFPSGCLPNRLLGGVLAPTLRVSRRGATSQPRLIEHHCPAILKAHHGPAPARRTSEPSGLATTYGAMRILTEAASGSGPARIRRDDRRAVVAEESELVVPGNPLTAENDMRVVEMESPAGVRPSARSR